MIVAEIIEKITIIDQHINGLQANRDAMSLDEQDRNDELVDLLEEYRDILLKQQVKI